MMTTMAAMLAAVPLALGTGVGSELRRPLGIAIIGGLIISQMLTLFTTPVIYLYLEKARTRFSARRRGRGALPGTEGRVLIMSKQMKSSSRLRAKSHSAGGSNSHVECEANPDERTSALFMHAAYCLSRLRGPRIHAAENRGPGQIQENKAGKRRSRGIAYCAGHGGKYSTIPYLIRWKNKWLFQTRQSLSPKPSTDRRGPRCGQAARDISPRSARKDRLRAGKSRAPCSNTSGNADAGPTSSDFLLSGDVSWEPDIWGRVRRLMESNRAAAQASAADLESVRLSVQAPLAQSYFQVRIQDEQKRILDSAATDYQKFLDLTTNRYKSGVASQADILQAQTQLKTTQAQAIDAGVLRSHWNTPSLF